MNGYQIRTEKKKEGILKAAFDLILSFGINKMSIAEVAKKAKVSPVSIYNYFGSKEGLVRSAVFHYMEQKIEEYEEILEENLPFQEKIKKIVFDNIENVNYLEQDLLKTVMEHPMIREEIEEFYQTKTIPFFNKLIQEGKRTDSINADISSEAVLLYLQIFKEAITRPGFLTQASPTTLKDLNSLLYFGLLGKG